MNTNVWFDSNHVEAWLNGKPIIHDLCLKLRIGESTAILGPNGSGKSTLLKLIDRNLYPIIKKGSHLKLFGSKTVNLWQLRKCMGVISTELEMRFAPNVSAIEIIQSGLFGSMHLGRDQRLSKEELAQSQALIEKLGLEAIAEQPFGHLSDGQRRRLMIARALVHEPKILVMDEPDRALDLKASHQLLATLGSLCREGITLLMATHQIHTIIPEVKRVIFFKNGQIEADGSPDQLLQNQSLSNFFETHLRVIEHQGFRQVLPG